MKPKALRLTKRELKLLSKMVNAIEHQYGVDSVVSFFKQYGVSATNYERLACKLALASK